MFKKSKLIIEQKYSGDSLHLLVKIENKKQVERLLTFLNRFVISKRNRGILKTDFNDIFKFEKTAFFSHRISDKNYQISYLVTDEGSKLKNAFIFFVITISKNKFAKLSSYKVEDYFEW